MEQCDSHAFRIDDPIPLDKPPVNQSLPKGFIDQEDGTGGIWEGRAFRNATVNDGVVPDHVLAAAFWPTRGREPDVDALRMSDDPVARDHVAVAPGDEQFGDRDYADRAARMAEEWNLPRIDSLDLVLQNVRDAADYTDRVKHVEEGIAADHSRL